MHPSARREAYAPSTVLHDRTVRDMKAKRIQCDEIWAFTRCKQKNVATARNAPADAGDVWTWTALDADTKLIVGWLVGGRGAEYADAFMEDVPGRLATCVQLTTDGHKPYLEAVEGAFGADVDYAQLVKICGEPPEAEVPPSALARAGNLWRAARGTRTSALPTLSARTSPCGCTCGVAS